MCFNQLENSWRRADLVVRMGTGGADAAVGKQLPHETLPNDDGLKAAADRRFADVECVAFAAPGHRALKFGRAQGDLLAQFLEAFLVQFHAIQIETNQKFAGLFLGGAFEDGLKQEKIE